MIRRVIVAFAAVTFAALLAPPGCGTGDCAGECCALWGESCNGECLPGQEVCTARPVGGPSPGVCACLTNGALGGDAGAVVVVVDDAGTEIDAGDLSAEHDGGVP